MTTDILKLRPTIKKAASSVAYNWPGVLDVDEAEQMISLKLLETPNSITKILGMERAAQYRAVVGIGHQLASQERADYDRYKGSYRYSVKEVKDALQAGALIEHFDRFNEVVFDIVEALLVLQKRTPQYVDSVLDRYADFNIPPQGAAAQRLSAALETLTVEMNKSHKRRFAERDDGLGTRRVLSNATAQRIASKQYDGTYDHTASSWERSVVGPDRRI